MSVLFLPYLFLKIDIHILLGAPNSDEYITAVELEMWKLSQEEEFAEKMRVKEAEYLQKLGKEWRKREEQRQMIFTEKVLIMICMCMTYASKYLRKEVQCWSLRDSEMHLGHFLGHTAMHIPNDPQSMLIN